MVKKMEKRFFKCYYKYLQSDFTFSEISRNCMADFIGNMISPIVCLSEFLLKSDVM